MPSFHGRGFLTDVDVWAGGVCISAGLNVQKLAHKRLEAAASGTQSKRRPSSASRSRSRPPPSEASPLLPDANRTRHPASSPPSPPPAKYAALAFFSQTDPSTRHVTPQRPLTQSKSTGTVPLLHSHAGTRDAVDGYRSVEGLPRGPVRPKAHDRSRSDASSTDGKKGGKKRGPYIKSPLWWLGISLLVLGELGNFVVRARAVPRRVRGTYTMGERQAYGFAPASVVAPLGTVALVANCAIAPLLIGETFDKSDLLGIGLAIIGAIQGRCAASFGPIRY